MKSRIKWKPDIKYQKTEEESCYRAYLKLGKLTYYVGFISKVDSGCLKWRVNDLPPPVGFGLSGTAGYFYVTTCRATTLSELKKLIFERVQSLGKKYWQDAVTRIRGKDCWRVTNQTGERANKRQESTLVEMWLENE